MKVYVNDKLFLQNITEANNFISRLIGLLNKKSIAMDEGLLLTDCSSIHCFFMKFTIDVIYLSNDIRVLYKETVKPWKVGKIVKGCVHILELAEGAAKDISVGDFIVFKE